MIKKYLRKIIVWALGYEPKCHWPAAGDIRVVDDKKQILTKITFNGQNTREEWMDYRVYNSRNMFEKNGSKD